MKSFVFILSLLIILQCCQRASTQDSDSVVQDISASIPNGIFNLEEIDLDFIFNSLVSPKGLVTQFALEVETQTIFTVGWIIASFIWQVIVINNIGGLQAPLAPLSFLLSTNAIAQTVVRSGFDSLRSLASRLLITLFVFGYDVTFSGIIENADPFSVGDFLFNPIVLVVAVGRAIAQITFFFAAIVPIAWFSLNIWPNIPRQREENRLSTDTSDYSYYGDYNGEYQTEYGGYGQDQGYGEGYADPGYLPLVRSINSGSNIGRALQGALDTIVENI